MAAYLIAIASFVGASVGPVCALLLVPQNLDGSSDRDATEASVWSIFQASPKNEYGRLNVDVAALALQSHFSRKRGWRIQGDNDEFLTRIEKLSRGGRGFSTRDLTEAAEAVEDVASSWTHEGLVRAYEQSNASTSESYAADKLTVVLEAYAKSIVLPVASNGLPSPAALANELRLNFDRQRLDSGNSLTLNHYSFEDASSMVADFMKQLEMDRHGICARQSLPQSCCFAGDQHHAICCHSMLDAIMSQLERKLQAPIVSPELMIRTVSRVSLRSMGMQYCPSKLLEEQVFSIAEQNDGTIPLHGQDFSAWLQRAFQKDCASLVQPRVAFTARVLASGRSLSLPFGRQELGRVAVAGLIGFAMLRTVVSYMTGANGALHGASDKDK